MCGQTGYTAAVPELPEVETIVRRLRARLERRRFVAFRTRWARNTQPAARLVSAALRQREIVGLSRRAKFVVFALNDGARLLVHLRMSGRLSWQAPGGEADEQGVAPVRREHVRATWALDDGGRLLFEDARKFGRICWLPAGSDYWDADLGPEPLEDEFSVEALAAILRRRARGLKALLLDQRAIAGLGNIYTDEALHRAGLHPLRPSDTLSRQQVERLHTAIRDVLQEGITHNGASLDWVYPGGNMQSLLRVYGRSGEPCRRCGGVIQRLVVGQRGTHVCPACQPPPRSSRAAGAARAGRIVRLARERG